MCRICNTENQYTNQHIPKFNRIRAVTCLNGKLKCNCPLTIVWGLPCVHSICIVRSLENQWEYFPHRDISVTWWNSYLQSAMTSVEDENKNNNKALFAMFRKLQSEGDIGISINEQWLMNTSIYSGELPNEFKEDNKDLKCLNNPNSNHPACGDFHPNSMDMFGFIQISSQNDIDSDYDSDNNCIQFPSLESNEVAMKQKTAYSRCIPYFKEAMDWIGSVGGRDDIDKVYKFLDEITGEMKRKTCDHTDNSTYVSSNLHCETIRHQHGADGRNPTKHKRH